MERVGPILRARLIFLLTLIDVAQGLIGYDHSNCSLGNAPLMTSSASHTSGAVSPMPIIVTLGGGSPLAAMLLLWGLYLIL